MKGQGRKGLPRPRRDVAVVIERCEIVTKTKWESGAACTGSVCQRDVEGEGLEGERHEHSVRTKLLHYFSVRRWAVYITGARAVAAMTR